MWSGRSASPLLEAIREAVRPIFAAEGILPGPLARVHCAELASDLEPRLEALALSAAGMEQLSPAWADFQIDLRNAVDASIGRVAYLGPMRKAPQWLDVLSGRTAITVGTTGERTVELLGAGSELTERTNSWLSRLRIPYVIPSSGSRVALFETRWVTWSHWCLLTYEWPSCLARRGFRSEPVVTGGRSVSHRDGHDDLYRATRNPHSSETSGGSCGLDRRRVAERQSVRYRNSQRTSYAQVAAPCP